MAARASHAIAENGHTCLDGTLDVPPQVSYCSAMAIHAGRHQFGTEKGRITLRTSRDGLAAQAGHDLTIDAIRWSGEFDVKDDLTPVSLSVKIDLGALVVRDGRGGIKPLTDRDRRRATVQSVLAALAGLTPASSRPGRSWTTRPGGSVAWVGVRDPI